MFKKVFSNNSKNTPTFLIVGLGNPSKQYENTRHNIGFMAVDFIAKKNNCTIKRLKYDALSEVTSINDVNVLLVKPQTFMNRSGISVQQMAHFYKIPMANIIVICDDVNFDVGKMRIRQNGSDGGHKGLKSIINMCESDNFPRIKLGAGQKPPQWDLVDWVVSRFSKEELGLIDNQCENVYSAVELIINGDFAKAMNLYN